MCKNNLLLLVAFGLLAAPAQAQSVLNTGGQTIAVANLIVEYSIGEVATGTLFPAGDPVTQGVLQPRLPRIVDIQDPFDARYGFECYPNPAIDRLAIETGYPDFDRIQFNSADGRLVQESAFGYAPVDCHLPPPGLYFVRLSSTHPPTFKTFKLIKQ